jgi:hypothetical protein
MNVVLPVRPGKGIVGTPHRIVAYDRATDEVAFVLPVPGFLNTLAMKIAEVGADDPNGLFCYVLTSRQVGTFQFLLGLPSNPDRYEYFLEPAQPLEAVPAADRTAQAPGQGDGQVAPDLTSGLGRDEARAESVTAFEELAARSQAKYTKTSRITESELTVPTLRILEDLNGEWVATSMLIGRLTELLRPSGADAEVLAGRHDTYFSQKVRNMISHRHNHSSFIHRGLAEYDSSTHCLRITELGVRLVSGLRV